MTLKEELRTHFTKAQEETRLKAAEDFKKLDLGQKLRIAASHKQRWFDVVCNGYNDRDYRAYWNMEVETFCELNGLAYKYPAKATHYIRIYIVQDIKTRLSEASHSTAHDFKQKP
jgi:hypothetical protein